MHNSDFDRDTEAIILRSGKRYRLEGKESNTDGDWNSYLEDTTITSLWGESKEYSEKRPTTPEQPKTPEVKPVTPPPFGSGTKGATPGASTTPPLILLRPAMEGGEMTFPVFYGNGSEDPQQHWFLCEAVWRFKKVMNTNMKAAQLVTTFRDRALN